jgi:hypothetical protein
MSKILLRFAVPFLFTAEQPTSRVFTFSIDSPLSHDIIAQSESILPMAQGDGHFNRQYLQSPPQLIYLPFERHYCNVIARDSRGGGRTEAIS